ncbi:MAG: ubiquinone biosynthesis accessory factor UbiJ [Rhodanobacteraceae bacterium]
MSTPALLCAGLEVALNRYLALEPDVLAECGKLSGRVIALHVDGLGWTFFIEFHGGGVRVLGLLERQEPDVTVSGPLTLLMRLAWKTAAGEGGVSNGLQVEGDTELLTRFNKLLARVGFDPEELLARIVGDTAAHRVNQGLQKLFGWGRRSAETLTLDTAEYLREETRDLARGTDAAEWMDSVDTVREGLDRLEARLSQLEERE